LVIARIQLLVGSTDKCTTGVKHSPDKDVAAERAKDLVERWPKLEITAQYEFVRNVLRRVVVGQTCPSPKLKTVLNSHFDLLFFDLDRKRV
jgi:hypothetical protein